MKKKKQLKKEENMKRNLASRQHEMISHKRVFSSKAHENRFDLLMILPSLIYETVCIHWNPLLRSAYDIVSCIEQPSSVSSFNAIDFSWKIIAYHKSHFPRSRML